MISKKDIFGQATMQPSLFSDESRNPTEPSERCTVRFREAINTAIRACRKGDRYWIASEMSRLLGTDVTKTMIDSWTSESLDRHIPLEFMPAFCRVTGSDHPLVVFAEILGYQVVAPHEQDFVELARLEAQIHALELKRERLKPRTRRFVEMKGAHR